MRSGARRRRSTKQRGMDSDGSMGTRTSTHRSSSGDEDGGADVDPERAARAIVLRQLTGQPRTRAELARALGRRGIADEVIEGVLGRFSEVGLIDDAAFARAWVDSRHTGRGLARRALAHELRRRGVEKDDLDAAVGQLTPETELATARALVARRLPSSRGLDGRTRVRRLAGVLARKGYPPGLSVQVVREALADEPADEIQRAAVEEFAGSVDALEEPGDG